VAYARAFGVFGARATATDELKAAWEEAASHPGPALIEAVLDAEAITPRATITSLREQAIAAGRGR
jgi:acetolactate synthase-1/2/3 large subunit